MTAAEDPATVLPSLALLPHRVRVLPAGSGEHRASARGHHPVRRRPRRPGHRQNRVPDDARLGADHTDHPDPDRRRFSPWSPPNGGPRTWCWASASPAEVEGRLRLAGERQPVRADAVQKLDTPVLSDGQDGLLRCGRSGDGCQRLYGQPARPPARSGLQGVRAAQIPHAAPRVMSSRAPSSCRRYGGTTTTAAPAPWTCISGGCAPNSAANTSI